MKHRLDIRVYYEDTDMGGIVYYANYLKFMERGRSDHIRELGVDQRAMKEKTGVVFAVRSLTAEYHLPAVYEDILTVETVLTRVSGARFGYDQNIYRGRQLLFEAKIVIVCIDKNGRATRVPADIRQLLDKAAA